MSNKNSNNTISLMQTFDSICDNALKAMDNFVSNSIAVSDCSYTGNELVTTSDYWYTPSKRWSDYDWTWWWTSPTVTYHVDTPSYPVSNYSIDKDGTSIIEIAVSGFEEDEITVKREDLKIIVTGEQSKLDKEDRKYLYKNIAQRKFELSYVGSEKWDYDKLKVSLKNGILTITIPVKEECKPVNQVYKINK